MTLGEIHTLSGPRGTVLLLRVVGHWQQAGWNRAHVGLASYLMPNTLLDQGMEESADKYQGNKKIAAIK